MPAPRPATRFTIPLLLIGSWLAWLGVLFVLPEHWPVLLIWVAGLSLAGMWGSTHPTWEFYGPMASRARDPKRVALSFDDGPDPVTTPQVAALLEEHGARGTFFCVGKRVAEHPEVVRRLVDAGHQVALHGHHHEWQRMVREPWLIDDLTAADAAVFAAVGRRPRWYRPPIGLVAPPMMNVVRRWRLQLGGWSVRPFDGRIDDPDAIRKVVGSKVEAGDVVLLHDAPPLDGSGRRPPALEALPGILEDLQSRGLEVVTMAELFDVPAFFEENEVDLPQRQSFRRGRLQLSVWATTTTLLLTALLFATTGVARAEPLPEGLQVAAKALAAHETVAAQFEQRKSSILFVEDMVRTGTLSLRRSDGRLLWEYVDGPAFLLADGKFYPAGKTKEEAGKEGSAGFSMPGGDQLVGVLQAVFSLEAAAIEKHFVATETAPGTWQLVPKDAAGKALFTSVTLEVGGEPLAVRRTTMVESTGDTTVLTFTDVVVDGDLPDARFQTPAERSE